jgi:Rab-GTPase-TBC domain/FYVE zinc finger
VQRKAIPIAEISQIEKSIQEPRRVMVMFFSDSRRTYDLKLHDESSRDSFVEVLASLSAAIQVKMSDMSDMQRRSNWVPDRDANACMRCSAPFSVRLRRHHCRFCGFVVCAPCSTKQAVLPDLGYRAPVRVCDVCFQKIRDTRAQDLERSTNQRELLTGEQYPIQVPSSRAEELCHGTLQAGIRTATPATPHGNALPSAGQSLQGSTPSETAMHNADERATIVPDAPDAADDSPAEIVDCIHDKYGFTRGVSESDVDEQARIDQQHARQSENWNTYLALHDHLTKTSELKRLVRDGIPPELRGRVWQKLSGSKDRQQNHESVDYYNGLLRIAEVIGAPCQYEIEKDLHRTFPGHRVFETKDGLDTLRRVLTAYSLHNPAVGYCQSMNFVCAMLLLFMEEQDAFWMMTTVLESVTFVTEGGTPKSQSQSPQAQVSPQPPQAAMSPMQSPDASCAETETDRDEVSGTAATNGLQPPSNGFFYYSNALAGLHIDQAVFEDLVQEKLPKVFDRLKELEVPLQPLTLNWFLCLFINTLPLETTLRIWDCVFNEGVKILFRAGLTLLKLSEPLILQARDFEQLLMFLRGFSCSSVNTDKFMTMCFESWINPMSKDKIARLRARHAQKFEPIKGVLHPPRKAVEDIARASAHAVQLLQCSATPADVPSHTRVTSVMAPTQHLQLGPPPSAPDQAATATATATATDKTGKAVSSANESGFEILLHEISEQQQHMEQLALGTLLHTDSDSSGTPTSTPPRPAKQTEDKHDADNFWDVPQASDDAKNDSLDASVSRPSWPLRSISEQESNLETSSELLHLDPKYSNRRLSLFSYIGHMAVSVYDDYFHRGQRHQRSVSLSALAQRRTSSLAQPTPCTTVVEDDFVIIGTDDDNSDATSPDRREKRPVSTPKPSRVVRSADSTPLSSPTLETQGRVASLRQQFDNE